ncbi:MAG: S-layer homology domain-containing protein [Oscillospiraceae bacterium]|nr:S-layer homology domain-containing protein [Oscillospiraceae bacterium]
MYSYYKYEHYDENGGEENAIASDNAMLWALENGVTSGTDATHFGPNQTCTRGQVVTFLYNTLS